MNYEIINERKKRLGITNAQLAEMTGISISNLDKITSGKKSNPTLDTMQAIADAIGCAIDDFRDAPLKSVSDRAMEVARAYDSMSPYGKSMIDKVVENEKKYRVVRAVPLVGELINDGTVEAKRAAKQEQRELEREENVLNSEKI